MLMEPAAYPLPLALIGELERASHNDSLGFFNDAVYVRVWRVLVWRVVVWRVLVWRVVSVEGVSVEGVSVEGGSCGG